MATAEELLRSSITQPNPEGHIVVGGDRFITVPDNLKRLGVQYDHNMETVVFDCPRRWDGTDMSQMAVYIVYTLTNGYTARSMAENVTADGDIMHFEWVITRNVTQIAGKVSFSVCVIKTNSEGEQELHWNSEICQDCYISKGMEGDDEPPIEIDPDLVSQLIERMLVVEGINITAGYMEQLRDEVVEVADTAERVKNEALDESNYIKNSYANAIKGDAAGEIIRVNDVSPIEHQVKCWVHGKNLLNDTKFKIESQTANGVTCTANVDGSYTLSGANTSSSFATFGSNRSTNYQNEPLIPSGIYTPTPGVTVVCRDEVTRKETNQQQTFEAINPFRIMGWYCYVSPNTDMLGGSYTKLPATIYPQLEQGSVTTIRESYIDPTTTTIVGCGKNTFDVTDYTVRRGNLNVDEQSGYSYTVQGAVGTSTNSYSSGAITFMLPHSIPIKDTVSVSLYATLKEQGAWSNAVRMWCIDREENFVDYKTFNLNVGARTKLVASFNVSKTDSLTGISFYLNNNKLLIELDTLQIECGDIETNYEVYTGLTAIPYSDGTCTVTSKSPTMTLFADTPGVIVEAEYNVDTVKFLGANIITDRIQAATDAWLTDHYVEAEGVSF